MYGMFALVFNNGIFVQSDSEIKNLGSLYQVFHFRKKKPEYLQLLEN
jgi:hypothetical protein